MFLQVKKHFQRFIEKEDDFWLSYNDTCGTAIPLKWHIPIGLLFDNLVSDDVLPWQITVNFKKYPEDVLFKSPTKWELTFNRSQSIWDGSENNEHTN